jgi:two-component system, cell cycle sensor histidine kinase and response regulator CckA
VGKGTPKIRKRARKRRAAVAKDSLLPLAEHLLEISESGILIVSDHGKLLHANSTAKIILGEWVVVGEKIFDGTVSVPHPVFHFLESLHYDALAGKKTETVEIELPLLRGRAASCLRASAHVVPIQFESRASLLQIRDVTHDKSDQEERNRFQNQMRQASKLSMLSTLAAGMAHEINNPLAAVRALGYLMEERSLSPEVVKRYGSEIVRSTHKMHKVTEQLRGFGRKNRREDWITMDVNQVIEESVQLLQKQMSLEGIDVVLNLAANLPKIWGERGHLESVFQNLLVNARDAFRGVPAGEQKQISIESKFDADLPGVQVYLRDNGSGMEDQVKGRIFEPFFTTKGIGEGLGLGLSVVRGIIRQHCAGISVDSTLGEGTTFTLSFPAVSKEQNAFETNRIQLAPRKPVSTEVISILLIDDEPEVGKALAAMLSPEFEVDYISDPSLVEGKLAKKTFDIVVTDVRMPKISGTRVLEWLTQNFPKIPVVLISGHVAEDTEYLKFMEMKAAGFIEKPFHSPAEVARYLRSVVENRSLVLNRKAA